MTSENDLAGVSSDDMDQSDNESRDLNLELKEKEIRSKVIFETMDELTESKVTIDIITVKDISNVPVLKEEIIMSLKSKEVIENEDQFSTKEEKSDIYHNILKNLELSKTQNDI